MTGYRADIDGLRCIAVLAVLFYHFDLLGAGGGFVGVDVFFVISGYLITGIVWAQIQEGRFSIVEFYERRIRRIFPALIAVCGATLLVAAVWHMPLDFKEFGESLFATATFSSNVYFYLKTGYFNGEAELRPLLHTWSLSVEEQFYVLLPLVLLASARVPAFLKWGLLGLAVASFVAALIFIERDAQAVFFMIWFRAWELLIGSLLAVWARPALGAGPRAVMGVGGLALIATAVWHYSSETKFPGATAVLPTVGAAAIIYAGGAGRHPAAWFLSLPVVVFIGKISYSLYLWHWPIVSFFRYFEGRGPSTVEGLAMLGASIVLAYGSWRWIEQPWRHPVPAPGRPTLRNPAFVLAGAAICAGVALGLVAHYTKGLPERLPELVATRGSAAFDINPARSRCDSPEPDDIRAGRVCRVGSENAQPSFVVMGDSFADVFMPAIDRLAKEVGRSGLMVTKGGCLPLQGVNQGVAGCREMVDAQLALVQSDPGIKAVLLIGRWTTASEGRRFGSPKSPVMLITDDASLESSLAENPRVLERGLGRTLGALRNKEVHLAAYVPEQDANVPRRVGLDTYFHRTLYAGVSRDDFDRRQARTQVVLARLASQHGFSLIDVSKWLCDDAQCAAHWAGQPLYVDDNHLTASAAATLRIMFKSALAAHDQ